MAGEFGQGVRDVAGPTSKAAAKGAALVAGPGLALVGAVIGIAGLLISGFFKAVFTHVRKLAGRRQEFVADSFFQAWEDFFSGMVRKSIGFPLLPYKGSMGRMHDAIVGVNSPNPAAGGAVNTSGGAAPTIQLPETGADDDQIVGASRMNMGQVNLDANGNPITPYPALGADGEPVGTPAYPNGKQVQPPMLVHGGHEAD